MPPPKKGKGKQQQQVMVVSLSPFRMEVRPIKGGGFMCEFVGTDRAGSRIDVKLTFPRWWMVELMTKLKKVEVRT